MSDLLPLPKHPVWRKVAVNVYSLFLTTALMFAWNLFRHKPWHWGGFLYLVCMLTMAALLENSDYYGWRNKRWPETTINMDRDEALSARKAIDNRSSEK